MPGAFNVSNAACALAAAELMGVDPGDRVRRHAPGHRARRPVRNRAVRRHHGPAAAGQEPGRMGRGAAAGRRPQTVVLAIDSAAADGRDVSWLWDVEYEQLAGRTVVATGPRAQDLAVRLAYAEVEYRCIPDLAAALAGHPEPVDVIATYTPFQRLRKMGGV